MIGPIAGTLAVLTGLSMNANRRLDPELARLPMQWSLTGMVGWTAPRRFALAFTPALALATLVFVAMLPMEGDPSSRRAALLITGGAFVAGHLLHLWLIFRWARQQPPP